MIKKVFFLYILLCTFGLIASRKVCISQQVNMSNRSQTSTTKSILSSELVWTSGEENIQITSAKILKNQAQIDSSLISLNFKVTQGQKLKLISLVFVLGPYPSEQGLQFFRKNYYHNILNADSLNNGVLRYVIPMDLFKDTPSAKIYLSENSSEDSKNAEQADKSISSGTVSINEITSSGITHGTYELSYPNGRSVTTFRTVYSFPNRTGAIEILDTPDLETTEKVWIPIQDATIPSLPEEVRNLMSKIEQKRISNILTVSLSE